MTPEVRAGVFLELKLRRKLVDQQKGFDIIKKKKKSLKKKKERWVGGKEV